MLSINGFAHGFLVFFSPSSTGGVWPNHLFPSKPGLSASTRHTFATSAAGTESSETRAWDWYIYLHEWLFLLVTYGKDR